MSEQTCEDCNHQDTQHDREPCSKCPCAYVSQWQPVPAPPEAGGMSVEALDALVLRLDDAQCELEEGAVGRGPMRDAIDILIALRSLVEDADCKRRIVEAGCGYEEYVTDPDTHQRTNPIRVWHRGQDEYVATWPKAVEWAEAQAAKREPRRSKPVTGMMFPERMRIAEAIGCKPLSPPPSLDYVHGFAAARGLYDRTDDTILLPEED